VIPFLLLTASETAEIKSTVYLDGSAERAVSVEYKPSRHEDLLRELDEALPHPDRRSVRDVGDLKQASRSVIWGSPNEQEGISLRVSDVLQEPLSLYTIYQWEEQVELPSASATAAELADPSRAAFTYTVEMPGKITHTSVRHTETTVPLPEGEEKPSASSLASAVVEANSASWALTGEYQGYTLSATSRRVRWGYLAVVLYVLAFIVYRIAAFINHRARTRPRRI
jgi:hypothetical protein